MAGLQGLQGLYQQTTNAVDESGILERSGTSADPRHGGPYLTGPGYPTQTGPYPSQGNQGEYGPVEMQDPYTGSWSLTKGSYDPDQSPIGHGGPFPAHGDGYGEVRFGEGPQTQWRIQSEGMAAHAADFGTAEITQLNPQYSEYTGATFEETRWESPGTTISDGLVVPKFILSGEGGGRDIEVLGNGGNPIFKVGHMLRRTQKDGIPYNYQWMDSSQRPFTVRRVGVKNTFDGPDSPYGDAGDETQNMAQSANQAAVMSDATDYVAPAVPTVAPASASSTPWAW